VNIKLHIFYKIQSKYATANKISAVGWNKSFHFLLSRNLCFS
jgi:hypothetical protein